MYTELKKIFVFSVFSSVICCGFAVLGLILFHNNIILLDTDSGPALVMSFLALITIAFISVLISSAILKTIRSIQDELSYIRNRIVDLEKVIEKNYKQTK